MNETLQYWAGISEHSCESSTPIGACLACDLAMIQDTLIAVTAQRDRLAEALQSIADCDWVITLPDRMDAVRDIARRALAAVKGESP